MSKPRIEPYLVNQSFHDIDDLTETIREWDTEFCQLESGSFKGDLFMFGGEKIQLVKARFNRTLEQHGSPPKGLRTFAIPNNQNMQHFWRGQSVCGNDLMVFPLGGELESYSNSDFDVFTLSISDDVFADVLETLGLPDPNETIGNDELFSSTPTEFNSLKKQLQQTIKFLASSPDITSDLDKIKIIESEILHSIGSAFAYMHPAKKKIPLQKREAALKNAIAYIKDNDTRPITLTILCKETQVSARTLQYAFKEKFGISPNTYLKRYRLNKVRKSFRNFDEDTVKVTDIANQWDFWHMGQFADDYYRMFGELPSTTRKNRNRSI